MSENKSLDEALKLLKKQFGEDAIMTFDDDSVLDIESISTGSLSLDLALGIGGLPLGRIVEIFGPESSGKSTVCTHLCANAQKAGYRVAYIDVEHAFDPKYAKALGLNLKEMLFSQPDSGEQAFQIMETIMQNKLAHVIIFDSVAAARTTSEINGEMGDNFIGRQAKLMSDGLKRIVPLAADANCLCVFTNQIRQKIGVMFGNPETTPGGEALKFYASVRMRISRKSTPLKEGDAAVASEVTVKVIKNKVAPPFREATFDIKFGKGIDVDKEILQAATKFGLLVKAGAWYKYNGENVGQGEIKTLAWLKNNPEIKNTLYTKVLSLDKEIYSDDIVNESTEETTEVFDPETGEILE